MIKTLSTCLCVLLFLTSIYGQEHPQHNRIQRIVDSLDCLKPQPYKKVRPKGRVYTISVNNQEQFNAINDEISRAIKEGKKNIQVKLQRGVYHFRQEHICRNNEQIDASLCFVGDGAVITSDEDYSKTTGHTNGWQTLRFADSIIQVVDEKKKLCMIPFANMMGDSEKKSLTKLQITQWFRTRTYKIERIDQKGIYFIAPELTKENGYSHKGYNVNFDYLYLGKTPRFRVYCVSKQPHCTASRFLTMNNCSYRCVIIRGIEFRSTNENDILLHMTNVKAKQILISDCVFDYIRGNGVAFFSGTGNVVFDGNNVSNTGGDELFFTNNCSNVRITNNYFVNCGENIGNTFCVRCYEAEYYIANNTFCDFGYGAIGVGVWHGFEKKYPSRGIIEQNEIYFTPVYFANAWKYMLMDSGAIYVWTQNDEVIIRYNHIRDYIGVGDNRGIFCDDGANNLKIYRNVVLNTPNSYSIDSRFAVDKNSITRNNYRNFMAYNVVDNGVRFQGHAMYNRHVVKGSNYILKRNEEKATINNQFDDLEELQEDVVVKSFELKGSSLIVIKE